MAYGLKVLNTNGTAEVFGDTTSGANFIASGSVPNLAAGATSSAITCEGMETDNSDTIGVGASTTGLVSPTITRGDGSFTVTNNLAAAATITYFAYRF